MPALNFMPRFADAVESGAKRQTIRKRRKDGRDPKPGDKLYLFTGQRTKKCRRLVVQRGIEVIRRAVKGLPLGHVVECKNVKPIYLDRAIGGLVPQRHLCEMWQGSDASGEQYKRRLTDRQASLLARRDGFKSVATMLDCIEQMHGLPFEGLLIRW